MTRDEITEFKAQTARRRAAEAEHPTPDAAAHDRATAAGLAVIRDVDHERALLEDASPCSICGEPSGAIRHRSSPGYMHKFTPAPIEVTTDRADRTPDLARIADDPETPIYVAETAGIMIAYPEEAILFDHDSALVIDREYRAAVVNPEVGARDLGHPAEPLFADWGVCGICHRPIHVRTDDRGGFVSAAHYA